MSTESLKDTLIRSYSLTTLKKPDVNYKSYKSCKSPKKLQEVEFLIQKMTEKFNNPNYEPVYRKAAWFLPDAEIHDLMEKCSSPGITYPCNYFVKSLRNSLRKKLELVNG